MAISKLILCASNQRLTAGVWFGTRLHYYETFANTEAGYQAFDAFVKKNPNMNAYLIADAIEEEYRLESLPHTSGKSRAELLERKLNQFNRNNLFRTAHFINQDKDRRRDDNFLFVALSNAEFLQGWMSIIQVNQVPLVGLYMLPMMSQYTVQQMKLMAPNILLCERLSSGLRQTYLSNGRLRMSRLAPIVDVKPNQMAYFYLVEIEKTRLYLLSQRFINDQTELQLVMPSLDNQSEVIGKSISQEQGMECKIVDSLAYAKNINIAPDLVLKHPELLHMQLLANGNIPDNLAPDQLTKAYHLNKIRQGIYVAAIAITLLGLAVAGYSFMQANWEADETAQLARQTEAQLKRYEEVASNFPTTPIPSTDLKTAIDLSKQVKQYNTTPAEMMGLLSSALERSPEVAIQRLRWVQTNRVDVQESDKTTDILGVDAKQANTAYAQAPELRQIAFVNAELMNFNGDYRGALTSVNQFVADIKLNPKVEQVVVLQEPVNVSSLANLKGSTLDENTSERTPAEFKLKIVLKQALAAGGE
jgi:hypothetical protein